MTEIRVRQSVLGLELPEPFQMDFKSCRKIAIANYLLQSSSSRLLVFLPNIFDI